MQVRLNDWQRRAGRLARWYGDGGAGGNSNERVVQVVYLDRIWLRDATLAQLPGQPTAYGVMLIDLEWRLPMFPRFPTMSAGISWSSIGMADENIELACIAPMLIRCTLWLSTAYNPISYRIIVSDIIMFFPKTFNNVNIYISRVPIILYLVRILTYLNKADGGILYCCCCVWPQIPFGFRRITYIEFLESVALPCV